MGFFFEVTVAGLSKVREDEIEQRMQLEWCRSRQQGRSRRRRGRAALGAAASAEGARAADAARAGLSRRPTTALTAPRAGAPFDPTASSASRTGTAPDQGR